MPGVFLRQAFSFAIICYTRSMSKPKVIAIVGATASGKTSLSIDLAKEFSGEIISADSRQVYRGLDIGTGKITEEEMDGVPHHLLDVADPKEIFTAIDFKNQAQRVIQRIKTRDNVPIIAGGTFFYIELLRGTMQVAPVPPDRELREELEKLSNKELLEQIKNADPDRAEKIDPDNRRRLIRSVEIIDTLGKVPKPVIAESDYEWLILGVDVEKEELRKKFAVRINNWLSKGFQSEVEGLLKEGVTIERMSEFGFEYTLMLEYIDGLIDKEQLVEKFIQKNWQYAKRQLTWLKKDKQIEWHKPADREVILKRVQEFLQA